MAQMEYRIDLYSHFKIISEESKELELEEVEGEGMEYRIDFYSHFKIVSEKAKGLGLEEVEEEDFLSSYKVYAEHTEGHRMALQNAMVLHRIGIYLHPKIMQRKGAGKEAKELE